MFHYTVTVDELLDLDYTSNLGQIYMRGNGEDGYHLYLIARSDYYNDPSEIDKIMQVRNIMENETQRIIDLMLPVYDSEEIEYLESYLDSKKVMH